MGPEDTKFYNEFGYINSTASRPANQLFLNALKKDLDEQRDDYQRQYGMKDSGEREEFSTGAVRDTRRNKGRYDLISPYALKRLAAVMERGAVKYGDRNWEKGMPADRLLDSALRHMFQYAAGDTDEDHLGHAAFNIFAIIHFQEVDNA